MALDVKALREQLARIYDLNEERQSDGDGAAHFLGRELKREMDGFPFLNADLLALLDLAERQHAALLMMVDEFAGPHDAECPGDSTCECAKVEQVESALAAGRAAGLGGAK